MKENQVQLLKVSEMSPSVLETSSRDTKKMNTLPKKTPEIEEKNIDLISVTSEDYKEDDQISFSEGRLQQWNYSEFHMQFMGAIAGIVLLFGCGTISAWAVTDIIKDVQVNEAEWTDVDYTFFESHNEDDFLASRHVIIAMVVLSFNVGVIVGGICGAFITPLLPNRAIYTTGSVLMMFTGISLTNHTSSFYCAKSRFVLGMIYGLVQLTIIVQAAESTTKKVRRWMLVIVAYVGAISNLLSTLLFYYLDDRDEISFTEENPTLYVISYILFACAILSLIFNFIFTNDTIAYYLNRGEDTKAFKEITRLKVNHLSMLDVRYEYERLRFDVAQHQLETNHSLAARNNVVPLTTMCCIRILNLLFTSVPITLVLIWNPDTSREDNTSVEFEEIASVNTSAPEIEETNENYVSPLLTLSILQGFRLLCSIGVVIRQDKYHFNRFCYKLAAFCGFTMIVWFVIRVLLGAIEVLENVFFFPVSIIVMMGFTGLPIPLDIIQLCQSADSYSRIKNTWSLACAIFVENIVHIFLIIQLDMIFGVTFVFLINGIAMIFFSYWLLKYLPNVVSIYPITVAVVARYPFKHAGNEQIIHI